MTQKISGIYIIVNTKNGKVYVGQAADIRERWNYHKRSLNGNYHVNRHLQHAWNKYGANTFKFQKLEYCSTDLLDEREQHYLDVYMPKGVCYNIAINAASPNRGRIASEETRRKLREIQKNRPPPSKETRLKQSEAKKNMSPETRRKIGEAVKNRPPISEEVRQKMSKAQKGRIVSEETRRKMSEANRPQMSEETRRKISETKARRRAEKQVVSVYISEANE